MILANEVHVWRAELDRGGWPGAAGLPAPERERAARLRDRRAGRRWAASRWALRGVLAIYLGEDPVAIELRLGPHGKPALAGPAKGLRFNLSHSGDLALVAVARGREVGVDVERIRPRGDLLRLAARALPSEAAAPVRRAAPVARPAAFHRAWVRHEATVKCLGAGLRALSPADPVAVVPIDAGRGFAAAVSLAGTTIPVPRLFDLDPRRARKGRGFDPSAPVRPEPAWP